jgi:invasion protein IalB
MTMTSFHSRQGAVLAVAMLAAAAAVAMAQAGRGQSSPPAQTLPGGATQMQETHGEWRVTCAQPGGQKVCTLSQQLADQSSRQLVVGIELKATTTDKAEGTLVLPFGLAVSKPIELQVDEGPPLTRTFRTCVPIGCLVDVSLEAQTLKALRGGTALHVTATADGGKEVAFQLPLKGFASALDRTAALSK